MHDSLTGIRAEAASIKPRAFSLELTKGCNLRCGYCYYAAREEAYDPGTAMSPEVAEQSVELLLHEAAPGEARIPGFDVVPYASEDWPILPPFNHKLSREKPHGSWTATG